MSSVKIFFLGLVGIFFVSFFACDVALGVERVGIDKEKMSWKNLKEEYQKGLEATVQYFLISDLQNAGEVYVCIDKQDQYCRFSRLKYSEEMIYAINSRYYFELGPKKDEGDWVLREVFNNPTQARLSQCSGNLAWGIAMIFTGIVLEGILLEDIVDSDSFEILSMGTKKSENDDNEYVELTFKSNFLSSDGKTKVYGGRVLLIPSQYWVIKNYDIDIEFEGGKGVPAIHAKSSRFIDYQIIDNLPFPKKSEIYYKSIGDEKIIAHFEYDYISIKRGPIPKEILSLSHYGFSEPSNPTRRGNMIRVIFVVSGLILIGFGLYLRYKGHKV